MEITPRTDIAVKFLQKWSTGPWVLTAISHKSEGIITKTFTNPVEMQNWIELYNGKRNLYFTINKTFPGDFSSKPRRVDIAEIGCLYVDCDPRIGEDLEEERTRILKSLQEFKPRPSIIISTGSGFQAFWLLDEPIKLDGTEETALTAESYSMQLEILLSADRTSNCDRIFRLPGTINLPNEVKLKKGRVPSLAYIVEDTGLLYPISMFTAAPVKIQTKSGEEILPGGGERIKITSNITPLYADDLFGKGIQVEDHIKQLIIHGMNPFKPDQYSSRSEPLFAVVCALVKAGADDQTIASVIMNRENKISESVLDKPRAERYCAKQIQNAREFIEHPMMMKMNAKHSVISDIGGKCRILNDPPDQEYNRRGRITYQTFDDFYHRYENISVQTGTNKEGEPIYKEAGRWWAKNAMRRQYETVVFSPGREVADAYNLWQGWACEAIPGDFQLFLSHILENICNNNETHYNYILGWMARCVQQPDCQGEVAIVLRGEMGTGKSIFATQFGSLFGKHFMAVSDPKHLVGSFNSHLRDCIVLFGDEAFFAGDKKHESVLKSLVTENSITIEAKGVDAYSSPNYTHIIMASNSHWVVPAGSNERRFFVLDVGKEKMQNKKYFAALLNQMNSGGREAMLHFFLNYDISNFEVRDVPKTIALQDQKQLSYSPEESWWFEKLEEGHILREEDYWEKEVMKEALYSDYVFFTQRMGILRKSSPNAISKFLTRAFGTELQTVQKITTVKTVDNWGHEVTERKRKHFYKIPDLQLLRAHWDQFFGGPFKWSTVTEQLHLPVPEQESEDAFK